MLWTSKLCERVARLGCGGRLLHTHTDMGMWDMIARRVRRRSLPACVLPDAVGVRRGRASGRTARLRDAHTCCPRSACVAWDRAPGSTLV